MSAPVMIAAGGTGGHVYPALVVAKELMSRGIPVIWVGTLHGIESRIVPEAGIAIEWIDVEGIRGKGVLRIPLSIFKVTKAIMQACYLVYKHKPISVLGMGGFVTGPVGVSSKLFLVPLVLHEQNAIAGFTNKILSKVANRVLQAFPTAFKEGSRVMTMGNPVRADIYKKKHTSENTPEKLRVLIVGGSLGAQYLNQTIPEVAKELGDEYLFWHQTGKGKSEDVKKKYYSLDAMNYINIDEFIDDMHAAYDWADIVICRSGAMTVSELAAAGMPSLLIPYPYAVDDHQTANAKFLSEVGGAKIIQQHDASVEGIRDMLIELSNDKNMLMQMSESALSAAHYNVGEKIADVILETAA